MIFPEHSEQLRITVFGGGGGGSVMAGGLVEAMPHADISVVVPTGDSGSKTGELREMFGGPAVGDTRKVLSAVAGNREAGELFGTRFGEDDSLYGHCAQFYQSLVDAGKDPQAVGTTLERTMQLAEDLSRRGKSLKGHTFGNLVLTALSRDNQGDVTAGIRTAGRWLDARANVIPVSSEPHNVMMYDRGRNMIIKGEGFIDDYTPADPSQVEVWLEPSPLSENRFIEGTDEVQEALMARELMRRPCATHEAMGAIALSDINLLAPGSPWTSQQPALLPEGISGALARQQEQGGLWVIVSNLFQEKPGLDLPTHLRAIQDSAGRSATHFIHNTSMEGLPEGKVPLRFKPEDFDIGDAVAIGEALVDSHIVEVDDNDPISHLRSPGHHDPWQVAKVLDGIVKAA